MNSNSKFSNTPLPYGWVQQQDGTSGRQFFVDTKANPPRSIWTHPYEDEKYLNDHPDVREKVRGASARPTATSEVHPHFSTPAATSKLESGSHPSEVGDDRGHHNDAKGKKKKGFMGALKEKAGAAMEEHKQRKAEQAQMMNQIHRQRMEQAQGLHGPQLGGGTHYASPMSAYPGHMMGRQRHGGMGGMGGMGMGLPLVGGLAGGMMLGSMMDNDYGGGYGDGFGDGGDFGGGDFGGGDF